MVGACAMGAVAGVWARPEVSDLKPAKEARLSAAKVAPGRPVLQIVDADLMPPPAERLEVLPAWVQAPPPPAVAAGPLRKVMLEPAAPQPPPPEPKPKVKAPVEPKVVTAEPPKPKLMKAKVAAEETAKAKAEPRGAAKLVRAKADQPKADKPKLEKAKAETPKAENVAKKPAAKPKADEPRLIKAKVETPKPKPEAKKTPKAEPAKAEPKASKLRVAFSSLKPAKEAKETVVAAAPAKPNKVEKVQKELAALSALPIETKKKVVVAEAKPRPKRAAPEQTGCAGRNRAEALLCENPQLAAADRRLASAYREAAEAGAPEWRLRRQQNRWLAVRERAADEAPWAIAQIYDARIAELEDEAAMARDRF